MPATLEWERTGYTYICHECGYEATPGDTIDLPSIHAERGRCPKCKAIGIPVIGEPSRDDVVNTPAHYRFGDYEVTPILLEWLKHNAIGEPQSGLWLPMMQYLFRFNQKKGLQDLRKAEWYLKRLMEVVVDE